MDKIFRIGHRNPNRGVITIASKVDVDANLIYYGASYCSPKEKQYNKQYGIQLSEENLKENIANGVSARLVRLKHAVVINTIICHILDNNVCPYWAESLLYEQLEYPSGLVRHSTKQPHPTTGINSIVVDSEYAKEQLILASKYLHSLPNIDTDFIMVNILAHLYTSPELVKVNDVAK